MAGVKETVWSIADPIAASLGLDLVEVEYVKEGKNNILRLIIDKAGGVGIEDCEAMSRASEKAIDTVDPIRDPYILEVSSPGLDRPLKTERDMLRHLGEEVEVKLYAPIDGRKAFEGLLTGVEPGTGTVRLDTPAGQMDFNRADIALMKRTIKFSDAGKGGRKK